MCDDKEITQEDIANQSNEDDSEKYDGDIDDCKDIDGTCVTEQNN